jgi:hypothetical protein
MTRNTATTDTTTHTPGPDTMRRYALRLQAMQLAGRGSFAAALSSVCPAANRRVAQGEPGNTGSPAQTMAGSEDGSRSDVGQPPKAHRSYSKQADCPACVDEAARLARYRLGDKR